MTGIAGRVFFDDQSDPKGDTRLQHWIKPRGRDGFADWRDSNVYLAHAYLASLPHPTHNLTQAAMTLRITGDIRLDNRTDVAKTCDIDPKTEDHELVLQAYRLFGENCCKHLIGDFAFAIWNTSTKTLFCARDPIGVRPFFYRADAYKFSFASTEQSLDVEPSSVLSDTELADFLSATTQYRPETRHEGIKRLLGGHCVSWRAGKTVLRQYFKLTPDIVASENAVPEFRKRFEQAVLDRMHGNQPAIFLSGGLDSSAICATAAHITPRDKPRLKTFSNVFDPKSGHDESPYIDAVLGAGRFDATKILVTDHDPLHDIETIMDDQVGLVFAPGITRSRPLYRQIASDGRKVVLDGHGGDEVVGFGTFHLLEMARQGKWLQLIPLIKAHNEMFNENSIQTFLDLHYKFGPNNKFMRVLRKRVRRLVNYVQGGKQKKPEAWKTVLKADFLARTDQINRNKTNVRPPVDISIDSVAFNLWSVSSPLVQSSFETLDKMSIAAGVEARYPFMDVRLISLCIGLPASEILCDGETRSILRRGLRDILPVKVLRRRDKVSFHTEISNGLIKHHSDLLDEMVTDDRKLLAEYIDSTALKSLIETLRHNPDAFNGGDAMFLWRVCCFYIWRRSAAVIDA